MHINRITVISMHVCTLVVLISTAAAPPSPWAPRGPGSLKSALYERCWSPTARPSWFRRQACLSFGVAKRSILPGRRHFHHPLPLSPISSTPKAELLRFVGSSNKWVCVLCVFSLNVLLCVCVAVCEFFSMEHVCVCITMCLWEGKRLHTGCLWLFVWQHDCRGQIGIS